MLTPADQMPHDQRRPGQRTLLAVLANPVPRPSSRSERHLAVAASILGFDRAEIANLFAIPSSSSRDIRHLGAEASGWLSAREKLETSLPLASGVLVGFGTIPTNAASREHLREQLDWLSARLRALPEVGVWEVGRARHPSRWHQYVSDVHARTAGGDFAQRLAEVLQPVPFAHRIWTA